MDAFHNPEKMGNANKAVSWGVAGRGLVEMGQERMGSTRRQQEIKTTGENHNGIRCIERFKSAEIQRPPISATNTHTDTDRGEITGPKITERTIFEIIAMPAT